MYKCIKDFKEPTSNFKFIKDNLYNLTRPENGNFRLEINNNTIYLWDCEVDMYFEPIITQEFNPKDSMEDLNQRKENKLNGIKPTLTITDDYDFEVKIKLKDLINLLK